MSSPEYNRERRRRLAEAEGRTIRTWDRSKDRDAREKRRLRKRRYDLALAHKKGRTIVVCRKKNRHDAHVQAYLQLMSEKLKERSKPLLHDAHFQRYRHILDYRRRYEQNPDRERARIRKYKAALPDAFVAYRIGLPVDKCPPDLIEAKRSHLKLGRILREKGNHENTE